MRRPPRVLSIAGSDPSGGAGIQADLKTFSALGAYGMAAITAVTVQSPRGVQGVTQLDAEVVRDQVSLLFADCPPDAIKIGMLGTVEVAEVLGELLPHFDGPVVLDPVLVATSGDALAAEGVVDAIRALMPLVTLITPNLPEAGALCGHSVPSSGDERSDAAQQLLADGAQAVLLKGGHLPTDGVVQDVLVEPAGETWFEHEFVASANKHGTGCTLSSAIAVFLARGLTLPDAVARATDWITEALWHADSLGDWGRGAHGPVHHFHELWNADDA